MYFLEKHSDVNSFIWVIQNVETLKYYIKKFILAYEVCLLNERVYSFELKVERCSINKFTFEIFVMILGYFIAVFPLEKCTEK